MAGYAFGFNPPYGLPGEVRFHDRSGTTADGRWHLIAAPERGDAPLKVRQQVMVYDAHLLAGREIEIPRADGMQQLLYVFDGEISAGGADLVKGDALADDENPLPAIKAIRPSTLVAFPVDRHARATRAGTISGGGVTDVHAQCAPPGHRANR